MQSAINPKQTTINFWQWAQAHNEKQSYQERSNRIRGGLHLTAKCILKDFLKAYAEGKTTEGYYETSTSLIATYTQQSRSTVFRHIKKLQKLGFITGRAQGGFGNNYKLQIRKDIIEFITIVREQNQDKTPEQVVDLIDQQQFKNIHELKRHLSRAFSDNRKHPPPDTG